MNQSTPTETVAIYQFEVYSIETDSFQMSRRRGDEATIKKMFPGARIHYASKFECSRCYIEEPNTDIPGLTARDFDPAITRLQHGSFPDFVL